MDQESFGLQEAVLGVDERTRHITPGTIGRGRKYMSFSDDVEIKYYDADVDVQVVGERNAQVPVDSKRLIVEDALIFR